MDELCQSKNIIYNTDIDLFHTITYILNFDLNLQDVLLKDNDT